MWKARLRYLPSMVESAGPVLNALVQATPCLRDQIAQDLADLRRHSTKLDALPEPALDPVPWFALMTQHPAQWKTIVGKAAQAYDAQAKADHTVVASVKPGRGDAQPEQDEPIRHMCYDCGRMFKHNKGLVMHRVRAHNHRSEHAAHICTEWCP
eukprot:6309776-Alexandrium_andersonii.AAC.1